MEYYSQSGEDRFLYENFFIGKNPGTFVDIGAHDGITGSNTLFFEKQRWSGICFEPMPQAYTKLCSNRSCLKSNKALTNYTGKASFVNIEGYSEQLSGLVENYSAEHVARINKEIDDHQQNFSTIEVDCGEFNNEVKFQHISVLSIDTEGSESKIIKSIDFNYFNILFIIVEFNYNDADLMGYLISKNYSPIIRFGINVIFKLQP